jgi:DNA polymerase III epsilon subunit-like protein
MSNKRLCFIHTETNGLHQTNDDVSKKHLFQFARLIKLSYEIGHIKNKVFVSEKNVEVLVKPRACYISPEITELNGISQELAENKGIDPEIILTEFKKDIKTVDIIITHHVDFHLKTMIAEACKYNIVIDYNKYVVIDIMSFNSTNEYIKSSTLVKKYLKKNKDNTLIQIKKVFFLIYSEYCEKVYSC